MVALRTALEQLLGVCLADWGALAQAAERIRREEQPFGVVAWVERNDLRSPRGLFKGTNYDVWQLPGGLALYRHPGVIERLLRTTFALLAAVLAPYYTLKRRVGLVVRRLASRMGALFSVLGLPIALLGFLVDIIVLVVAFVRSIPSLVVSPLMLLKALAALPIRLVMALLARLFWALFLPWLARILESVTVSREYLERLLKRFPWLRGVLLGFLRRDRPPYPVLIPKESVSQILVARRRRLFRIRTFLIMVEGEPLKSGLTAWLRSLLRRIVLPFYWERSVHLLCLHDWDADRLVKRISAALERSAVGWR